MIQHSVLMFDGSSKPVSEIVPGDRLMGPDSSIRTVKNVQTCYGEAWQISPIRGKPFILGSDNYICLMHVGQENYRIDIHVSDLIKQSEYFKSRHNLYRSAVDFTVNHEPVINPYFLGLLLGDACLRSVPIRLSNPDNEVLDYVAKIAETMGLSANVA